MNLDISESTISPGFIKRAKKIKEEIRYLQKEYGYSDTLTLQLLLINKLDRITLEIESFTNSVDNISC